MGEAHAASRQGMALRPTWQTLWTGCICHSPCERADSGCSPIRRCHRQVVQKAEAQTEQTPHHKDQAQQQAEAAAAPPWPSPVQPSPATWS